MLKKVLAVFPVFIFFAFSGLFVFVSPSSSVVFQSLPQILTADKQKQNFIWEQIKSELKNRYTYLDFNEEWKPLFAAAKDDTQYAKEGSELEEEVKNILLVLFAAAKNQKMEVLEFLFWSQFNSLTWQQLTWNSLVDAGVAEQNIDALLNPQYAYLVKTSISIKKGGKEYKGSLEPLFLAAKKFGVVKTEEEFSKIKIPGFREIVWDFKFLFFVRESDINAAFAAANAENKPKINNLWSGIKDELKKPEYAYLVKTPIPINDENYDLELLFEVAQSSFTGNGYALPLAAKIKLQDLVNGDIDAQKLKDALAATDAKNKTELNNLWTAIKSELKKPEYAHLSKTPIPINNKNYDLKHLFEVAHDFTGNGYDLDLAAKMQLQDLVNPGIDAQKLKDALDVKNNENLNTLWTGIKDELKKAEYAYLSKTFINIGGTDYNLELLFTAAKDDTQYQNKGSQLPDPAKDKLQELVNDIVTAQNVKDALDVKNNENLNTLWSDIKDELKKLEYAHLTKTPITVGRKDYNLGSLFAAAKDDTQYEKKGSELSAAAKNKLQSLVSADVQHPIFKTSLAKAKIQNNQKLDNFWTQLKKILNQPEFDKWKDTSIKIKNKNYDLKLLFAAAKDKTNVKGSAFSLDAKLQLQELVNDQVTFKMVENQLLALNQAEAAKNQQAKEKQQSQDLTIGLATGGGVLVAAGLGGFLYWFFRIRK